MKKLLLALLLVSSLASAQTANTAVLSFTRPTTYSDGTTFPTGTNVSYGIYQALQGVTPKPRMSVISSTANSVVAPTINTGLLSGKTYCWNVTTIVGTDESGMSNEACKTFAPALPTPPTLLIVN
jgi:hypothetical protein